MLGSSTWPVMCWIPEPDKSNLASCGLDPRNWQVVGWNPEPDKSNLASCGHEIQHLTSPTWQVVDWNPEKIIQHHDKINVRIPDWHWSVMCIECFFRISGGSLPPVSSMGPVQAWGQHGTSMGPALDQHWGHFNMGPAWDQHRGRHGTSWVVKMFLAWRDTDWVWWGANYFFAESKCMKVST